MLEGTCHCGAVAWTFNGTPPSATACNCTICRRTGTLWIYGLEGETINVTGESSSYVRGDHLIGFHFCPVCSCNTHFRMLEADEEGRRMMAVNVRLSEPETVADLPVRHFEGLDSFTELPGDGRCVRDLWF